MPKIVIAAPLYPPEIGGPATYARILEEELPKRGWAVELMKFSDVRHLPSVVRHIIFALRVFKYARSADVIYVLDAVSVGWPAYFANLFLKKKFVVKMVGDHIWEQGNQRFNITSSLDEMPKFALKWHPYLSFLRVLQGMVMRGAHRVIVPSMYLKRIVEGWGIETQKIHVIYNAADLEAIGSVPPEAAALPSPRIVSVGRLVPWKHMGRLIEAVKQVRAHVPASLVIVGGGPLRLTLMRHAREKLGSSAVVLGTLSHADTLAVMKSADIFVLNSSYEGLSHVLIEALCLGKPIIATRAGGNPELIQDGVSGLLVPVGDTEALAATVERVLTNEALRARLREGALRSAARFDRGRMVGDTVQALLL